MRLPIIFLLTLAVGCATNWNVPQNASADFTIEDDQKNDTLVLFVHGLTGSRSTWDKFLKVMNEDEELLRYVDVATFEYKSDLWGRNSPIKEIAGVLRSTLDVDYYPNYKDIFLIGHSMGGLVIKSMVIQELKAGKADKLKGIQHIILFGTPNNGVEISDIISGLHPHLKDLDISKSLVHELRREWVNRVYKVDIRNFGGEDTFGDQNHKQHIPETIIIGTQDQWVKKDFAQDFYEDSEIVLFEENHQGIKEPTDMGDERYKVVRNILLGPRIRLLVGNNGKERHCHNYCWHEDHGRKGTCLGGKVIVRAPYRSFKVGCKQLPTDTGISKDKLEDVRLNCLCKYSASTLNDGFNRY